MGSPPAWGFPGSGEALTLLKDYPISGAGAPWALIFFLFVEKNYLGRRYSLEQTPSQDGDFLGFDRGVLLGVFPVFHGVTQSVV